MRQVILCLLVIALSSALGSNDDSPIVSIECGKLRGKVLTTPKGKCDTFLGVPFAAPPIGQLRFDKPQPLTCWTETQDATEFAPICIQNASNDTDPKIESEDCLYLNVFVPNHVDTKAKLPVMVFIHGGGFVFGSAKEYGDVGVCENLASRGVIVVTVQYRLFLYGFLSTGDKAALGNFGLWDQIASLEWVQRNIAQFGGDPNKVTIFGESAGAASVSFLTYTPAAKDLFHQSIAESGSAFSPWALLNDNSVDVTKKLAEITDCSNPDQIAVVNCLRQLSTSALQKAYHSLNATSSLNQPSPLRVDGELFKTSQLEELKNSKPAIIGVNSQEMPALDQLIPQAELLFDATLNGIFPGKDLKSTILKQATRYVYLDSKGDRTNSTFVCQQFAKMASDSGFRAPSAQEAVSKVAASRPVWMYKFDHYSKNIFPPSYLFERGAPHAHELCYIFLKPLPPGTSEGMFTCPSKYEGDDRIVADRMGEMWTNFAINGDPSSSSLQWPQFHSVIKANTMHIQTTLSILPDFYLDISNFWNYLITNIEQDFDSSQNAQNA